MFFFCEPIRNFEMSYKLVTNLESDNTYDSLQEVFCTCPTVLFFSLALLRYKRTKSDNSIEIQTKTNRVRLL